MPGLAQSVLNYGKGVGIGGLASIAGWGLKNSLMTRPQSLWANRTLAGGVAGGLYGALSDNTSVLGGAAMGAGFARYGLTGLARTGSLMMNPRWGAGNLMAARSGARVMARMARNDGMAAGRFIGRNLTKGYNKIRGLGR